MLTLRTLGTLGLRDSDGKEISPVLSQPKRFALLVYLAVARPTGLHRRDTLLGLFWPEREDARGRNALSQGLSHLRRNLSDNAIVTRGADDVGLAPGVIKTDVEEFEAALEEARWADALAVYGGDFLPGFHVGEAWGFGEWAEAERERLREAAAGAAWALAQEQVTRGALVDAERTAQKALGFVWSDETPVRDFIKSLTGAGDRAAALKFYEKFRSRLWEELELEPSPQTISVAEAIRNSHLDLSLDGPPPPQRKAVPAGAEEPLTPSADPVQPADRGPWKLWFWSLTGAAIVCFAIVGFHRARWSLQASGPPPADRPFTVLAQVAGSADPEDRDGVGFLLQNGLDASHVVQTVPVPEIDHVLTLMDRDPGTPLSPALAREVAIRLGVSTMVLPRLDRHGEEYSFVLRVEDVQEGILRAEGQGVAGVNVGLVAMVDTVSQEVRRRLGESPGILAQADRLPRILTPSLQALKDYHLGYRLYSSGQVEASLPLLRKAVATDTAFAHAWITLAQVYSYVGLPDSAAHANHQALLFQDRLTESRRNDRILVSRMQEDVALWDRALDEASEAVQRDPTFLANYSHYLACCAAFPDSALDLEMEALARRVSGLRMLDPSRPASACWVNPLYWSAALDRVDEWRQLLDSLRVDLPEDCDQNLSFMEALAAAEWDLADSLSAGVQGNSRWQSLMKETARQLDAVRGRIGAARRDLGPGDTEDPRAVTSRLFLDLFYGVPSGGTQADSAPSGHRERVLEGREAKAVLDHVLYGMGEALHGDTTQSRRVLRELEALKEAATSRAFEASYEPWFILMEAWPAARRGDWAFVVDHLEPLVEKIDDPGVGNPLAGDTYLARWLLSEAYQNLGEEDRAVDLLESTLIRPRTRINDWILQGFVHPRVRLRLGDLYTQTGNTEKAAEHYRAFLATFTDPDPEFQWMVEEAQEGLAALGAWFVP